MSMQNEREKRRFNHGGRGTLRIALGVHRFRGKGISWGLTKIRQNLRKKGGETADLSLEGKKKGVRGALRAPVKLRKRKGFLPIGKRGKNSARLSPISVHLQVLLKKGRGGRETNLSFWGGKGKKITFSPRFSPKKGKGGKALNIFYEKKERKRLNGGHRVGMAEYQWGGRRRGSCYLRTREKKEKNP